MSLANESAGSDVHKYFTITELTREFGEGLIHPERRGRTRLFRSADRHLIKEILRGRRLGFTINEIREIIEIYKGPPGELGQLQLMMTRVAEKRKQLNQKRQDIEDTLSELDHVDEACLARLAELRVGS